MEEAIRRNRRDYGSLTEQPSTSRGIQHDELDHQEPKLERPWTGIRYNDDDDYDVSPISCQECFGDDCICNSCTIWGYIFCFNRMSRYRRIEILWVWIALMSVCIGLCVGLVVFGVNPFTVAPTDMRIITDRYSTLFCDKLDLWAGSTFDTYRFFLNQSHFEYFKKQYDYRVHNGEFQFFQYYLIQWSTIEVVSCSGDDVVLYVIAGTNNFEKWKSDKTCVMCYIYKTDVKVNGCFLDFNKFSTTVSETDTLYFVFMNRNHSTWITATFKIKRVLYDVSNAERICANKGTCSVKMDFNSREKVVYHMSGISPTSIIDMTSTCKSRMWLYVVLFAATPSLIAVILSGIVFFACKEPKTKKSRRQSSRDRSRHTSEQNDVEEPPKYEDILPQRRSPPAYEEIRD